MIRIDKMPGELLSELVARARAENSIAVNVPITYAGRLDPMAEGAMILLVGDETKMKEKYMGLDKTYSFELLLGVSTDTHDALGVIDADASITMSAEDVSARVREVVQKYVGEFDQEYPAYSSKTINGRPLFELARTGEIESLPQHRVALRSVRVDGATEVRGDEIAREAMDRVGKVNGDFRQEEIIDSWRTFGAEHGTATLVCVRMTAVVGAGFYVRVFARDIARELGLPGLAWSIRRESIAESRML